MSFIKQSAFALLAASAFASQPHADDFPDAYSQSDVSPAPHIARQGSEPTYAPVPKMDDGVVSKDGFSAEDLALIGLLPPKYQRMITPQIFAQLKRDGVFAYLLKQKQRQQADQSGDTTSPRMVKIVKILHALKLQDASLDVGVKEMDKFISRFEFANFLTLPPQEVAYIYRASLGRAALGGAYVDNYGLPHSGSVILHGVKMSVPANQSIQQRSAFEGNLGRPSGGTSATGGDSSSGSVNKMTKDEWFADVAKASWDQIYQVQYMPPAP